MPMIVIIALLLAAIIYFFRTNPPLLIASLKEKLFSGNVFTIKLNGKNEFEKWFVNSLPDGLWMFAFTLTLLVIWKAKGIRAMSFWIPFSLLVGVMSEILQKFKFVPGTFDVIGILTSTLFFLIAFSLYSFIAHNKKFLTRKILH